jgi:ABC-2 type transport system ATP-binding protein
MTEPVIELEGVGKSYRFFQMSDVSLRLDAGQILGFVGPNGAGKTTTIRILMGMIGRTAAQSGCSVIRSSRRRRRSRISACLRGHASPGVGDAGVAHALHRVGVRCGLGLCGQASASTCIPSGVALSHGERVKASLLLVLARRRDCCPRRATGLDPVARHRFSPS